MFQKRNSAGTKNQGSSKSSGGFTNLKSGFGQLGELKQSGGATGKSSRLYQYFRLRDGEDATILIPDPDSLVLRWVHQFPLHRVSASGKSYKKWTTVVCALDSYLDANGHFTTDDTVDELDCPLCASGVRRALRGIMAVVDMRGNYDIGSDGFTGEPVVKLWDMSLTTVRSLFGAIQQNFKRRILTDGEEIADILKGVYVNVERSGGGKDTMYPFGFEPIQDDVSHLIESAMTLDGKRYTAKELMEMENVAPEFEYLKDLADEVKND